MIIKVTTWLLFGCMHVKPHIYELTSFLKTISAMHWVLSKEPEQTKPVVPLVEDVLQQEEYLNGNVLIMCTYE